MAGKALTPCELAALERAHRTMYGDQHQYFFTLPLFMAAHEKAMVVPDKDDTGEDPDQRPAQIGTFQSSE